MRQDVDALHAPPRARSSRCTQTSSLHHKGARHARVLPTAQAGCTALYANEAMYERTGSVCAAARLTAAPGYPAAPSVSRHQPTQHLALCGRHSPSGSQAPMLVSAEEVELPPMRLPRSGHQAQCRCHVPLMLQYLRVTLPHLQMMRAAPLAVPARLVPSDWRCAHPAESRYPTSAWPPAKMCHLPGDRQVHQSPRRERSHLHERRRYEIYLVWM